MSEAKPAIVTDVKTCVQQRMLPGRGTAGQAPRVFTLLSDPEKEVIQAYDVWKEKKNYGKVSMGVVRTIYLINENGIIIKAFDKVKAADNLAQMLGELE